MSESMILPEQSQGYTGRAQLGMDMSRVMHRILITGHSGRWRKKMALQLGVGQYRRPSRAAGSKAIKVKQSDLYLKANA
jgi:hypothetical protein